MALARAAAGPCLGRLNPACRAPLYVHPVRQIHPTPRHLTLHPCSTRRTRIRQKLDNSPVPGGQLPRDVLLPPWPDRARPLIPRRACAVSAMPVAAGGAGHAPDIETPPRRPAESCSICKITDLSDPPAHARRCISSSGWRSKGVPGFDWGSSFQRSRGRWSRSTPPPSSPRPAIMTFSIIARCPQARRFGAAQWRLRHRPWRRAGRAVLRRRAAVSQNISRAASEV